MKFKGKTYRSKKHPILEYIFNKYYTPRSPQEVIPFYLSDISEGYRACRISEPVSISNTILDLTRQDRGIKSRVPDSISALGYDLEKKTGTDSNGKRFAGQFVHVGVGNSVQSWLVWPDDMEEIIVDSSAIPEVVRKMIRPDEGGLFSVIDYTDLFSKVLNKGQGEVFRVQNPMKWQPNEIDGFYASEYRGEIHLYPVEAKALTTQDEINMNQLRGGYDTVVNKAQGITDKRAKIQPIAVKMIQNGIACAIFAPDQVPNEPDICYKIKFDPPIESWQ